MHHTVASVPFLNAKPLVWSLERAGDVGPVKVLYDWPSRLPAYLEGGQASAILVSSIDALTVPDRAIAAGCCISSPSRVMSVRLFSRIPFDAIETMALDASSMTSNALARIVMSQMFGIRPHVFASEPDGTAMLASCDACVLIGDKGLTFDATGLYSLDLGEAWHDLTGLPFVWACWVGHESLDPGLVSELVQARWTGERSLSAVAGEADPSIPPHLAHEYLTTVFRYTLGEQELRAMREFGRAIVQEGLAPTWYEPKVVEAAVPAGQSA